MSCKLRHRSSSKVQCQVIAVGSHVSPPPPSFCMIAGFEGSFPAELMRFSIVARIARLNDSALVNTVSTKVGPFPACSALWRKHCLAALHSNVRF